MAAAAAVVVVAAVAVAGGLVKLMLRRLGEAVDWLTGQAIIVWCMSGKGRRARDWCKGDVVSLGEMWKGRGRAGWLRVAVCAVFRVRVRSGEKGGIDE